MRNVFNLSFCGLTAESDPAIKSQDDNCVIKNSAPMLRRDRITRNGIVLCLIFVLTLSGCLSVSNSPASRFYTLSGTGTLQSIDDKKFDIASGLIIGVGPVKIPEYLNRPQIVTQDKNKMLKFAEFDRWGESLDSSICRLINEGLTVMLPSAAIRLFPWNLDIPVDYQVIVDIVQLECELDKDLYLVAQWSVIDLSDRKMMLIKRSEFRQPISPRNYSGLAKTLSVACASLSEEIAQALSALPPRPQKKENAAISQPEMFNVSYAPRPVKKR
ncbi:MAG: PqiC family protein [Candidatus Omnitrophota bacterium]